MIQHSSNQNNDNATAIIIPSLNPDEKLKDLVNAIRMEISESIPIILVDDGSNPESKAIFSALSTYSNTYLLTHHINKGKGQALRTAFDFILKNMSDYVGVITVDGDGQHSTSDIKKCMTAFKTDKRSIVLGSRHFDKEKVPLRSRFGNILTRKIIKGMNGLDLTDTQTGLRVIPTYTLKKLLALPGDRYEYELNMLLFFKEQEIPINEVPIKTIYLNENESSHFNPLIDSIKIYSIFLKYSFSSVISFLLDISLFALFVYLLERLTPFYYIIIATVCARLLSGCFNYLSNKHLVFNSKHSSKAFIRYVTLFLIQMIASAFLVESIVDIFLFDAEWVVKMLVDLFIFCAGYYVQKNWVFKDKLPKVVK
ncbi:glycosyltransferase [Marinilactibacillus kalidii]|uniref:glycosyltransferase n=1 Tax=Marinilactibacillus kalidii TaxID=2820274 RepID=UPI001ABE9452